MAARRVAILLAALTALLATPAPAPAQKAGGVLNVMHREDPGGFSIHEGATPSVVWSATPCFSNLVLLDPFTPHDSASAIRPELATRWSWQDGGRSLVFFLRHDVTWHDGRPFTSRDVKHTFDMVREAPEATAKLRVSPRKLWYANVEAIEAPDPFTVAFRLKRPQPSLLMLLASAFSPVYPAHVDPAEMRTRCVGTGPFKLKDYRRNQLVEYERNPDYFVKGRPYLAGLRFVVITERGTRVAALQAGQLDVSFPSEMPKTIAENVKKAVPALVVTAVGQNAHDNLLMNNKKPPFDNPNVRRAVSLAVERRAYIQAVRQGGAVPGAALGPPPAGLWGLGERELAKLPGYGDPARNKVEAQRLLAAAGFGPNNPLKVELVTRSLAIYLDFAGFLVDQLRQVGIQATLKQVETGPWFAILTRRDYQMAVNLTAMGIDDPDAVLYENFKCGSPRNYQDYCNEAVDRLIDAQSQEADPRKRQQLVWEIQRKLEEDAGRPIMGWRLDFFTHWPHVKNFIAHHSLYNYGRFQDTWLDK
ncbi:MAG: ABC transporter substrate-binding protein [Candidatus Rokubacteria bacterium]|nr:ABC transporter substrate-binding protein [Candidatus Rokubacteria bacterium]